MRRARSAFALALALVPLASGSWAEDKSVSPYIDELKGEMEKKEPAPRPEAGVPDPYIQSVKSKISGGETQPNAPAGSNQPYIDEIKQGLAPAPKEAAPGSYSDQLKSALPPKDNKSAIQAVAEGHSELEGKRVGDIHHAFGFRYGGFLNHDYTSGSQLRSFNDIYGSSYALDLSLFYEYQPFHSEWYGNIGIMGNLGVSYFHGNGIFQFQLTNPVTHLQFPTTSNTVFQFFNVPVMLGLDYRFNLARLFRPFVAAGPVLNGFIESRSDGVNGNRSFSTGLYTGAGVSLLLDWIAPTEAWDLYASWGVKHYYLTAEYSRITPVSGDVKANVSGVSVGLAFEY